MLTSSFFLGIFLVSQGLEKVFYQVRFPNCICKKNQYFEFQDFHLNQSLESEEYYSHTLSKNYFFSHKFTTKIFNELNSEFPILHKATEYQLYKWKYSQTPNDRSIINPLQRLLYESQTLSDTNGPQR